MKTADIPKVDVSAELDPSPVEIVNTEGKGKGKAGKKGKGGGGTLLDTPVFDSKDVELNAAMLLRFLQANCKNDGASYWGLLL